MKVVEGGKKLVGKCEICDCKFEWKQGNKIFFLKGKEQYAKSPCPACSAPTRLVKEDN